jgi:peptidoglycan-associated lipoprotein
MKTAHVLAALMVLSASVAACKHAPVITKPDPIPGPVTTPTDGGGGGGRASNPGPTNYVPPSTPAGPNITAIRATVTDPIYFEYDSDNLMPDAKALLERKYSVLVANATVRIRIEGNADERGSDEYNLALGQRRAESAKRYLVSRGLDASRMTTVSYGEERPAVSGSTDESWSKNRRDGFSITSGEITVGMRPVTPGSVAVGTSGSVPPR